MPPAWEEKGKCWLGIYLPKEMRQREKLSPSGLLLTFLSWNNPQSCLPPLPTHQQAGTPPGPTPCSLPAPPQVPRWELKGELSLSWPGGCSLGPGPDLCNYVPELEAVSMRACMLSHLSRAQLFATIRTVACPTPGWRGLLERVAIFSSRGSSPHPPRDGTHVSYVSFVGRRAVYQLCHLGSPGCNRKECQNWKGS